VNATLVVNNEVSLSYTYEPRIVDGMAFGLNTGMVGIGANNSIARIDNVAVQVIAAETTFEGTEQFPDTNPVIDVGGDVGIWGVAEGRYVGAPTPGESLAYSLVDLGNEEPFKSYSMLDIEVVLNTETMGGVIFDLSADRHKFAAILPDADQLVVGHVTKSGTQVLDAVVDLTIDPGVDHTLTVSLKGTSVTVALDGQVVLGHFYNGVTSDGGFGLYSVDGATSFDSIQIRTDDPSVSGEVPDPVHDDLDAVGGDGGGMSDLDADPEPLETDAPQADGSTEETTGMPIHLLGLTEWGTLEGVEAAWSGLGGSVEAWTTADDDDPLSVTLAIPGWLLETSDDELE
jgi:hypothetical protein